MSRRSFTHGTFEVVAGWDRPLGHYFLDISDTTQPTDEQDTPNVFSSMQTPPEVFETWSLTQVARVIMAHRIPIPEAFLSDLAADPYADDPNQCQSY